jgi:hypothetical protein
MAKLNPNTWIIYEGPSRIDGEAIVVLASGFTLGSANTKTGQLIQTYILLADVAPTDALRTGQDVSVCGGCIHRPKSHDGVTYKSRSCFVNMQTPAGMWKAYRRGSYGKWNSRTEPYLFKGRKVRLGAYGDPAAVSTADLWDRVLEHASAWTGYTHQSANRKLRDVLRYCVVSADSVEDSKAAQTAGLSSFRVLGANDAIADFEQLCPASAEAGKIMTCAQCLKCSGGNRSHIVIAAHGIGKAHYAPTTRRALRFA